MKKPAVSVVLGSYNRKAFLKETIKSVCKELDDFDPGYEIIVIDGGSSDGSLKWLARQKNIISIIQHNRGSWKGREISRRSWGYFMNLGFRAAQGKYVCMLSDDCLVVPGALKNGYSFFEEKINNGEKLGALAFYWRNWPEQQEYMVGLTLQNKIFVNHGMYLKQALEDVGYIDEDTFLFYHADGDLCLKMWQQGYTCIDAPDSYIEHFSHVNMKVRQSNNVKQQEDWTKFLNKWQGIFIHSEDEVTGSMISRNYSDLTYTANGFKKANRFEWYIKRNVFRILRKIFSVKNK